MSREKGGHKATARETKTEGITVEGTWFPPLELYLVVQSSRLGICRILLRPEAPPRISVLAERIACSIVQDLEGNHLRIKTELWPPGFRIQNPVLQDHEDGSSGTGLILDLTGLSPFTRQVLALVRNIPRGQTETYGHLAEQLNLKQGARAVGQALGSNPFPLLIPCHRVVASRGLGGYSMGTDVKKTLLQLEGV